MIKVVNKKNWRGGGYYIGRPSPLGNPFRIGRDGSREEVIRKYRVWLWGEIKKRGRVYDELLKLVEWDREVEVTLLWWCKPLPCHGDVIKRAVEWLARTVDSGQ